MYLVDIYHSEKGWYLWCTRDRYEWKESKKLSSKAEKALKVYQTQRAWGKRNKTITQMEGLSCLQSSLEQEGKTCLNWM